MRCFDTFLVRASFEQKFPGLNRAGLRFAGMDYQGAVHARLSSSTAA